MSTKISNLSELHPLVINEEKISGGVLGMIGRFDLTRLLKPLSGFKTRGISLNIILSALILCRFHGLSIYSRYKSGQKQLDENTLYRMMNHSLMDWRAALRGMAMQFLKIVRLKGENSPNTVRCFIIDDTTILKTGFTIEGISKVFDHTVGRCVLGFKQMVLAYWDGKSLLPVDCSCHRESQTKNYYGLTKKQSKRQYKKERAPDSPAGKRLEELDMEKTVVAVQMLQRACKHGILASLVLIDSWFVNEPMIKGIRKIRKGMMHVLGMCNMARKYTVDGRELKSDAIVKMKGLRKDGTHHSRKYKSDYIQVDAIYKDIPVRVFYIKYRRAKCWKSLLTTDLSLTFTQAMEQYHIRWSIEVMFKECKQYLRMGQGQNTDFDGQIADMTITLITHLILSLQLRFQSYETMGCLFREVQDQMIQDTLYQRIMQTIMEIIEQLMEIFPIDLDEAIEDMIVSDERAEKVKKMLMNVNEQHQENIKNKSVI
jgi:hypothetical protein